jgi:hypothetical protein
VSIFPTKILLATDGSEEAQQAARATGELSPSWGLRPRRPARLTRSHQRYRYPTRVRSLLAGRARRARRRHPQSCPASPRPTRPKDRTRCRVVHRKRPPKSRSRCGDQESAQATRSSRGRQRVRGRGSSWRATGPCLLLVSSAPQRRRCRACARCTPSVRFLCGHPQKPRCYFLSHATRCAYPSRGGERIQDAAKVSGIRRSDDRYAAS